MGLVEVLRGYRDVIALFRGNCGAELSYQPHGGHAGPLPMRRTVGQALKRPEEAVNIMVTFLIRAVAARDLKNERQSEPLKHE